VLIFHNVDGTLHLSRTNPALSFLVCQSPYVFLCAIRDHMSGQMQRRSTVQPNQNSTCLEVEATDNHLHTLPALKGFVLHNPSLAQHEAESRALHHEGGLPFG
jgi:hypothetical protein